LTAGAVSLPLQGATEKTASARTARPNGYGARGALAPNSGNVTQVFQIANPEQKSIAIKMRIKYTLNGSPTQIMDEFSAFPTL